MQTVVIVFVMLRIQQRARYMMCLQVISTETTLLVFLLFFMFYIESLVTLLVNGSIAEYLFVWKWVLHTHIRFMWKGTIENQGMCSCRYCRNVMTVVKTMWPINQEIIGSMFWKHCGFNIYLYLRFQNSELIHRFKEKTKKHWALTFLSHVSKFDTSLTPVKVWRLSDTCQVASL